MASCAAPRRPPRWLASISESKASPKRILSPSGVVVGDDSLVHDPAGNIAVVLLLVAELDVVLTSTVPTTWTQPGVRSMTATSRPRPMFDNLAEEVSGEM